MVCMACCRWTRNPHRCSSTLLCVWQSTLWAACKSAHHTSVTPSIPQQHPPVHFRCSLMMQKEKMYLINGIAIKNLLGASPSLDLGVISFLWHGSLSTGNHSMFYQKSEEQRNSMDELYNQTHVLVCAGKTKASKCIYTLISFLVLGLNLVSLGTPGIMYNRANWSKILCSIYVFLHIRSRISKPVSSKTCRENRTTMTSDL